MQPPMQKPLRILVLEDNLDDLLIVEELLAQDASRSYRIERVDSVAQARATLAVVATDIFLLDLNLPFTRGRQTIDSVADLLQRVPTIVSSGLDDEALRGYAAAKGARAFLNKGELTAGVLLAAIRQALPAE